MKAVNKGKVVVGMSGGVDSSVALYLLKKEGYEPIGISLKYDVWQGECNIKENVCCSKESFDIAREICSKLGVEHHTVEVKDRFDKEVIDYFTNELKAGKTPSPCVFCNRNLKFKVLLEQADKFGADFVATGHYAKIQGAGRRAQGVGQEYELLRAKDKNKDQTYSLCFLPPEYLSKTIFPLGNLTKDEVYGIAEEAGFDWFEKRKQSQDFCFVSGSAMDSFLVKEIGVKEGEIVDEKGTVLGNHKGLHFYTIGQRKGINLDGRRHDGSIVPRVPYFVVSKDNKRNRLIVSKDEKQLNQNVMNLTIVNFITNQLPKLPVKIMAKIRSTQELSEAVLQKDGHFYKLVFKKPQRAVTPGQVAVFYLPAGRHGDGETCLGGGVIS